MKRKVLALVLALCMVFAEVPAFALEAPDCHPEHTPDCGYVQPQPESPCTHTHDESCGYVAATQDGQGHPCTHTHDRDCGYAPAVEGAPCTHSCPQCALPQPEPPAQAACTCGAADGEAHAQDCPQYALPQPELPAQAACTCGAADGESHAQACPLYTPPEEITQRFTLVEREVEYGQVVTVDETGEEVRAEADEETQPALRAFSLFSAPVGSTVSCTDGVNMGQLVRSGTPEAVNMSAVLTPGDLDQVSDLLLNLRVKTISGAKVTFYLNGRGITTQELGKNTQLTVGVPLSPFEVKSDANLVEVKLESGNLIFQNATLLVNGGAQASSISEAFTLKAFVSQSEGADLVLRSTVSGFTGKAGIIYHKTASSAEDLDYTVKGSSQWTHTRTITSGLGCQMFLYSDADYVAYASKQFQLKGNALGLLDMSHVASPQLPATTEAPTHRVVSVTARPTLEGITITGWEVLDSFKKPVTPPVAVSQVGQTYTFPWGRPDKPVVKFTYTTKDSPKPVTEFYEEIFLGDMDLTGPTFAAPASVTVLTKTPVADIQKLILAGVKEYNDTAGNNAPEDISVTVNATEGQLAVAGTYDAAATVTAKDSMGNPTAKPVSIKVENRQVELGIPVVTPGNNNDTDPRSFTATLIEDGGKSFTEYGFVVGYGQAVTYQSAAETVTAAFSNGSLTASLSVEQNIQYYVRAYAKDSSGSYAYSDAVGFSRGPAADHGQLTVSDVKVNIPYNGITDSTSVSGALVVSRPTGSIGTVSVDYTVAVPDDLQSRVAIATSGTLSMGDRVYSASIPFTITDDRQFNQAKSLTVSFTNPTSTVINTSVVAQVTVSYTTNYKAVLKESSSSKCLLPEGFHTMTAVYGTGYTDIGYTVPWPTGWALKENGSADERPTPKLRAYHDSTGDWYNDIGTPCKLIATVPITADMWGKYCGAAYDMDNTNSGAEVMIQFYNAADGSLGSTTAQGTAYASDKHLYTCAVPQYLVLPCGFQDGALVDGAVTEHTNTTAQIPNNTAYAKVYFKIPSGKARGFFFGVLESSQLTFKEFLVDTTKTYFAGDKVYIYPVCNSAITVKSNSAILVNGEETNYDKTANAFVYTIPDGATGSTLDLVIKNDGYAYYTVDGQSVNTSGDWCNITPNDPAVTKTINLTPAPTISFTGATTGTQEEHSVTVTAQNNTSGTLEYIWTASTVTTIANLPTAGWQQVPAGGAVKGVGYTGQMNLWARTRNAVGKMAYSNKSFSFSSPASFSVDAAPAQWQRAVTANFTKTNVTTVTVTHNGEINTLSSASSYAIPESGTYLFTATNSSGFSKSVVRSYFIDKELPIVTVTRSGYQNGGTYRSLSGITVAATDQGGSGLKSLEYAWTASADLPSEGDYAPVPAGAVPAKADAGTWYLHLRATDNAGNTGAVQSLGAFTVDTSEVKKATIVFEKLDQGQFKYTITAGTNAIDSILLPDGTTISDPTPEQLTNTVTLGKNGEYTLAVVDALGNTSYATYLVNDYDEKAPEVQALACLEDGSEAVYGTFYQLASLTVKVTATDDRGVSTLVWKLDGQTETHSLAPDADGKASFAATANGLYLITATDAAGNFTTEKLYISSIDSTAPAIAIAAEPDGSTWYATEQTVSMTITDDDSGVASVTLQKDTGTPSSLEKKDEAYSFTTTGTGTYTVVATDGVGNTQTKAITVQVDTKPVIKVTAKAGTADYTTGTTTVPVTLTLSNTAACSPLGNYSYSLDSGTSWTELKNGAATLSADLTGTYSYTFKVSNTNFAAEPASFTVTIDLPDVTGITVTPYSAVYDSAAHGAVSVTGAQSGDTVTYSTSKDGSYSATVPQITAVADNKTIYVKVERAGYDAFTASVASAMQQKEAAVTFTVPTALVYDGTAKTVTAVVSNLYTGDVVTPTLENATYTAKGSYTTKVTGLTGAAAGNYKLPDQKPQQAWAITAAQYPEPDSVAFPTAGGITYGQALSASVLTGGDSNGTFTWQSPDTKPASGTQIGTVLFTPTNTSYEPFTRTVTVAVAKKEVTLSVSGTKLYHAAAVANSAFTVSGVTGMVSGETKLDLLGTLTFASTGNTVDSPVASYDVTVAQSGDSNYTVTTTSVANGFTVIPAAQTLTGTVSYTKLSTDADFALDIVTDSTDEAAQVLYTLTDGGSGAITLADGTVHTVKPGTAVITAGSAATQNFAKAEIAITVQVDSLPVVHVLAAGDITATTTTLRGTVRDGTIAVVDQGLEYRKAGETDYLPASFTSQKVGELTTLIADLSDLAADTEYQVRAFVRTAQGTQEELSSFSTAPAKGNSGSISGTVTDGSGVAGGRIVVSAEAGNTVIASVTLGGSGGSFSFTNLPDGFYNLVADNGEYRVTHAIQIQDGAAVAQVSMTIGKTQSVVEIVTGDTPRAAVDKLPELFQNANLYTGEDKAVVAAQGTVEFRLLLEKLPEDAADLAEDREKIEKAASGQKVSLYLDVAVLKTIRDQNGRVLDSQRVPDLQGNQLMLAIPLPKELQGMTNHQVFAVHEDGEAQEVECRYEEKTQTLLVTVESFSTYAVAGTFPSSGSSDEDDFWGKVDRGIASAPEQSTTVKVDAGGYENLPAYVVDTLRKNPQVTLVIRWDGGEDIVLRPGKLPAQESGRVYYPLSLLAQRYQGTAAAPTNPETGGGELTIVVDAPAALVTPGPGTRPAPQAVLPAAPAPSDAPAAGAAPSHTGLVLLGGVGCLALLLLLLLLRRRKEE